MTTTQDTRRPFGVTHPAWIACAVVMGLVLALAVYVLLNLPATDDQPHVAPLPAASCDLPASDATGLTGTPDATWTSVNNVAVPGHPDHGPARKENGLNTCYALSPEGAVFAAANMTALGATGDLYTVYDRYTIEGPERDRGLAQTPVEEDTQSGGYEIAGFRLQDYDPEQGTATVRIAMGENGQPPYGALEWDLVRDGDWRYDPNSTLEVPFEQVSDDLDGYYRLSKDGN